MVIDNIQIDYSSPAARGKRLARVRCMTGLDRQPFAIKYGMSDGTLRSWESGRYAGLTEKGAKQMVALFRLEGIQCSEGWLLQGRGSIPIILEQSFIKDELIAPPVSTDLTLSEEITLFCTHRPQAVSLQISDDGMEPLYCVGDYVAGERFYNDDISSLMGQSCIIETQGGEKLVRSVRAGSQQDSYTLQCLNLSTQYAAPTVYDIKLLSAAPVILHRKRVSENVMD
ncbi:MAG: hypothetical protein ACNA7Y_05930 [Gammaproteobacteria bacterium]